MKFAVVETGGKQYLVQDGSVFTTEIIKGAKVGENITFDKVLLIDDGTTTQIGDPYIKGATITAQYEAEGKGKKVVVVKYKAKSRYHKKRGHRQPFAKVSVKSI
ncbi:MAG TPA: 50S ribosomal protein L21 [Candidatus Paceibacterota bacterium]|nr:50S ribosomal protein L21 [Candidatus Paceibacterota bacterium]